MASGTANRDGVEFYDGGGVGTGPFIPKVVPVVGDPPVQVDSTHPLPVQTSGASASLAPLGFEQISVGGTAGGLTVPTGAKLAVITVEVANVRWRDDGVSPTASVGMLVASGQSISYSGDLGAIGFIAVSGSPVIDVSYYK